MKALISSLKREIFLLEIFKFKIIKKAEEELLSKSDVAQEVFLQLREYTIRVFNGNEKAISIKIIRIKIRVAL